MIRKPFELPAQADQTSSSINSYLGLRVVLWTIWALAITGFAFGRWYIATLGQRPLDLIELIIHTLLLGVVGLVVLTRVEMWFEPTRFLE